MKNLIFPTLAWLCLFLFPLSIVPSRAGDPPVASVDRPVRTIVSESALGLYRELALDVAGLSEKAFRFALLGMEKLRQKGRLSRQRILTIVDFSLPSDQQRLFVIDLYERCLLYQTYVAHGQGSGTLYARQFSNRHSSWQSSLGFYLTDATYAGRHGYSLRLRGLEKGINDNAYSRAIVMHGAAYVSEGIVRLQGYLGRSQGCPAVPEKWARPIIDEIKGGSLLFVYSGDASYIRRSTLIRG